ncbi:alpha/beta fold hydrolase [Streptomyces sp. NPDC020807]|uniref:thioesterase II family protein n=1 Tax=Streptomyces sp. NPDC020807 TaxID=3155119 RepID=UPI003408D987
MSGTRAGGEPEIRLFGFHHAGGSSALYHGWADRLPESWDVRWMDAPGHGKLMGRQLITELDALTRYFQEQIEPELDVPYAFFGHSMGGIVAFELAHRLIGEGRTPPVWLGLSACRAPSAAPLEIQKHLLDDDQFREHVRGLRGTPALLLDDPGLWGIFGPLIRADLRLVETWQPDLSRAALDLPLTVFGGHGDTHAPQSQLAQWAGQSENFIGPRMLDGDHFYFSEDPGPLLEHIVRDVRSALGAVPNLSQ